MSSKFSKCPEEVHVKLQALLEANYKEHHAAGITYDLIFAYGARSEQGELTGPAIKHGGYRASGLARIVSLKDRVMGRADAEILLDGDEWERFSPEQQDALLDHEMQHFVIARDIEGGIIKDTHGRVKLKMKLHDFDFGWFKVVAERHGANSMEVEQASSIFQNAGQTFFPFLTALGGASGPKRRKQKALK